jgi:LytS/YehU family sensor histidine kinase
MILQPLVENAIRHGVACSREGGWVSVSAAQTERGLMIEVSNNIGTTRSNGTGVGLRNAEARLKYLYSGDASLQFSETEDHIATVRLRLPVLNAATANLQRQQTQKTPEGKDLICEFSSSTTNH